MIGFMDLKTVELKVKNPRLMELGVLPRRASDGSAGFDIASVEDKPVTLGCGDEHIFGLGFAMFIKDPRWSAWILPRSGLSTRHGVVMMCTVGLIDSDFQGQWIAPMYNRKADGSSITIQPGERIGQIVFLPVGLPALNIVDEFSCETTRGTGGLGSTGK